MKKRVSIILVISILTIALVASFAGCNAVMDINDGLAYLDECIAYNKTASQYHIKTINIYDTTTSLEIKLTVFAEDPTKVDSDIKSAKITVVTTKDAIASYTAKIWGDSLKKGVKEKKATEADYKRDVMFSSENGRDYDATKYTEMTFADFLKDEALLNASRDDMVEDLEMLKANGIKPDKVTRNGKVTNFVYENIGKDVALKFGFKENADNTYPLFIECVDGYVSRVGDKVDGGSRIISYTRQGPNIQVPKW